MRKHTIVVRNYAAHVRKNIRTLLSVAVAGANQQMERDLLIRGREPTFSETVEVIHRHITSALGKESYRVVDKRSNYEPLFSIPPTRRRPSAPAKPVTLVERRAVAAKRKVREWQRKAKLAATKIKAYRRKVSYYTKKGVIQ